MPNFLDLQHLEHLEVFGLLLGLSALVEQLLLDQVEPLVLEATLDHSHQPKVLDSS